MVVSIRKYLIIGGQLIEVTTMPVLHCDTFKQVKFVSVDFFSSSKERQVFMSNYEQYAEKKQPELLKQTRTLNDCIKQLKSSKESGIYSQQFIDDQIDFVAALFDLSVSEIQYTVDGVEYWCL